MEFPSQKYWSWLPFLTPGDLPDPWIEPVSLASPALHLSLPLCYMGIPVIHLTPEISELLARMLKADGSPE